MESTVQKITIATLKSKREKHQPVAQSRQGLLKSYLCFIRECMSIRRIKGANQLVYL